MLDTAESDRRRQGGRGTIARNPALRIYRRQRPFICGNVRDDLARRPLRVGPTPELICGSAGGGSMGTVRTLPTPTAGVRLADAAKVFLGAIPVANPRRGYAVVLDRLVRDFGADGNVALLDPDRGGGLVHLRVGWRRGHEVQRPVGLA